MRVCSQQYLSRGVSIFSFERMFIIFEPVPLRPCQKWWCLDELLRYKYQFNCSFLKVRRSWVKKVAE